MVPCSFYLQRYLLYRQTSFYLILSASGRGTASGCSSDFYSIIPHFPRLLPSFSFLFDHHRCSRAATLFLNVHFPRPFPSSSDPLSSRLVAALVAARPFSCRSRSRSCEFHNKRQKQKKCLLLQIYSKVLLEKFKSLVELNIK